MRNGWSCIRPGWPPPAEAGERAWRRSLTHTSTTRPPRTHTASVGVVCSTQQPSCLLGHPAESKSDAHKEQVEQPLAGHLAQVETIPSDRVADLTLQPSFMLEGAMARARLEGRASLILRARALVLHLVDQAGAAIWSSTTTGAT